MQWLELADFLLLAEAVTGLDAAQLADVPHVVARAESALAAPFAEFRGVPMYPDLAAKAAVLCSRLLRNHPLPDGNKRAAYLCMIELIRRNGGEWSPVAGDDERAAAIERLAAREIDEAAFAAWVERQMTTRRPADPPRPRTGRRPAPRPGRASRRRGR